MGAWALALPTPALPPNRHTLKGHVLVLASQLPPPRPQPGALAPPEATQGVQFPEVVLAGAAAAFLTLPVLPPLPPSDTSLCCCKDGATSIKTRKSQLIQKQGTKLEPAACSSSATVYRAPAAGQRPREPVARAWDGFLSPSPSPDRLPGPGAATRGRTAAARSPWPALPGPPMGPAGGSQGGQQPGPHPSRSQGQGQRHAHYSHIMSLMPGCKSLTCCPALTRLSGQRSRPPRRSPT